MPPHDCGENGNTQDYIGHANSDNTARPSEINNPRSNRPTLLYQKRLNKKRSLDPLRFQDVRDPTPFRPRSLARSAKRDVIAIQELLQPPTSSLQADMRIDRKASERMIEFYQACRSPDEPVDPFRRLELYHLRILPGGAHDASWAEKKLKQLKRRASRRGSVALESEKRRRNRLCTKKRFQRYKLVLIYRGFREAFKRTLSCPKRRRSAEKEARGFLRGAQTNRPKFSHYTALDNIWRELQYKGPINTFLRKRLTLKLVRSARALGNMLAQLAPVDFDAATDQREEWIRDMNRLIDELTLIEKGEPEHWDDWYEHVFGLYDEMDRDIEDAELAAEMDAIWDELPTAGIQRAKRHARRQVEHQAREDFFASLGRHNALMAGMFLRALNDIPVLKRVIGNAGVALENNMGDLLDREEPCGSQHRPTEEERRWESWTGERYPSDAWLSAESCASGAQRATLLMWHLHNWQRQRTILDAWDEWLVESEYLEDEDEDMDAVERLMDASVADLE